MKKVLLLLIGWLSAIGTIHAEIIGKEVSGYYEGTLQETSVDFQSPGSSILDLNLLTIASNGKTQVAVKTNMYIAKR